MPTSVNKNILGKRVSVPRPSDKAKHTIDLSKPKKEVKPKETKAKEKKI